VLVSTTVMHEMIGGYMYLCKMELKCLMWSVSGVACDGENNNKQYTRECSGYNFP